MVDMVLGVLADDDGETEGMRPSGSQASSASARPRSVTLCGSWLARDGWQKTAAVTNAMGVPNAIDLSRGYHAIHQIDQ